MQSKKAGRPPISENDIEVRRRVGAKIREARFRRGMKQCELAEAIGIPPDRLCNIEHGKAPQNHGIVIRLAEVLGVDWQELIRV